METLATSNISVGPSCCLAWPFRTVEGVACSVATVAVDIVGRYQLQRTVYTPVCTFIYNANHIHTPLVLDCRIPNARSAFPCVSLTFSCRSNLR